MIDRHCSAFFAAELTPEEKDEEFSRLEVVRPLRPLRCAPHAQRALTLLHTLNPRIRTHHMRLHKPTLASQLLHTPARLERRKRKMAAPPQMAAPSPAVQTAVKPKKKVAAASSSDDSIDMDVEIDMVLYESPVLPRCGLRRMSSASSCQPIRPTASR